MPYMPPLQNCGAENITPGRAKECSLAVCSRPRTPVLGRGAGRQEPLGQTSRYTVMAYMRPGPRLERNRWKAARPAIAPEGRRAIGN